MRTRDHEELAPLVNLADITEIDGSHVVMLSQPDAVTEVILKAHKAVS